YSKLTEFKYGEDGKKMSPAQVVSTVEKAVGYAEKLSGNDLTTLGKEDVEMIKFLREEIVEADWVYPIVKEALNGVRDDYPAYGTLIDVFMKSPEVFENNVNAVLDLAESLLEKELIAVIQKSENPLELLLDSGFDAEIGEFLNSTDEIVKLKKGVIDAMVMGMAEQGDMADQIKDTLLSGFSDDPITDKEDQAKEGKAILLLAFSTGTKTAQLGNVLEALATHPMIGVDRVGQFITSTEMVDGIDETILNKLIDKLKLCTTEGYDGPRFAEYYSAIEGLLTMISTQNITELIKNGEANLYFLDVDPDALIFASELFNDYLDKTTEDMGATAPILGGMLAALPEEIKKLENDENFDAEKEYQSIATVIEIAEIASDGEEKLEELINSYSSENRIEVNGEVIEDPLAWYAESALIPSLMETMVEENGSDPMGIGESLTTEQKEVFAGHLDDYLKEVYPEGNEDLEKDLETLKAFLGMN
ncbi:MAG: hypothetical protein IJA58_00680, partial [Lachnospiraceae bacterium]|nr:hypothetical protein [Lachnospiraceae bacterium]